GLARPTLVVDRERLAHNVGRLKANLPANKAYRIVSKSLPSLSLIREGRVGTGSDRLMVFDQPFLNFIARDMPDAQGLMGKPVPVIAAKRFFEREKAGAAFDSAKQVQWLVDTHERLAEYRELAQARHALTGSPLRVNLEIDVGLHRGGFRTADDVGKAL